MLREFKVLANYSNFVSLKKQNETKKVSISLQKIKGTQIKTKEFKLQGIQFVQLGIRNHCKTIMCLVVNESDSRCTEKAKTRRPSTVLHLSHVLSVNLRPFEENRVPVRDLLVLVFSGDFASSCTVLVGEHRSH